MAVRYDPFDAGFAYAFVRKQWLQCHSEYYAVLKDRSQREIMFATNELHQAAATLPAAFTVTARQLAEFLQSIEGEEKLLIQRLSDLESKDIRLTLADGFPSTKNAALAGIAPRCRLRRVMGNKIDDTAAAEV